MQRRQFLGLGAATLAALATGCSAEVPGRPIGSPTGLANAAVLKGTTARTAPAAVEGKVSAFVLHQFAIDLFRATEPGTKNAAVSPYSVQCALGMAALGARSAAAQALATAQQGSAQEVAAVLTAVDAALAQAVKDGQKFGGDESLNQVIIEAANSLYTQSGLAVRPEYLEALAAGYGSGVRNVDFAADPEVARGEINRWVAERTLSLIPELLPDGSISDQTLLVLVNALYVKALWSTEFTSGTAESDFATAAGSVVKVKRMKSHHRELSTQVGKDWNSVTIPYKGGGLAMTVIVPEVGKFAEVRDRFDPRDVTVALRESPSLINLELPAFSVDTRLNLTDPLKKMGLEPLFGSGDLSGIAGAPGDLSVTQLLHQTKIGVDIHGTEAAAATGAIAAGAAPGGREVAKDFFVDRPFLFVIHDTTLGCPLFFGQITDPTA